MSTILTVCPFLMTERFYVLTCFSGPSAGESVSNNRFSIGNFSTSFCFCNQSHSVGRSLRVCNCKYVIAWWRHCMERPKCTLSNYEIYPYRQVYCGSIFKKMHTLIQDLIYQSQENKTTRIISSIQIEHDM